jgi:hypothetical protein
LFLLLHSNKGTGKSLLMPWKNQERIKAGGLCPTFSAVRLVNFAGGTAAPSGIKTASIG